MLLFLSVNHVDSYHGYVHGPMTLDTDEAFYAVIENTQTSVKKIYNSELTITKI